MKAAKTTKAILNTGAGAKDAVTEPITTPINRRQRPQAHDLGDHRALLFVRDIRAHRGRNNDGERGADAQLHAHVFRHIERAEHLVQHRHDDGAAADAEQAGKDADQNAGARDPECEQSDLADRISQHAWIFPDDA